MRKKGLTPARCGLIVLIAFITLACTGEAPEIRQVFWQLNLAHDLTVDAKYESLSVFVHVADADGINDVDLMYILQDKHELLWEMDVDGWKQFENGDEIWIGSNNIRMNDGSTFPRALYRLIVIDRAGERSTDEFFINADVTDIDSIAFPSATVLGDVVTLEGSFNEFTLWFYDEAGSQVKIFTSNAKELPLASVLNARERQIVDSFYVNALDQSTGYGFVYGPVDLEPPSS